MHPGLVPYLCGNTPRVLWSCQGSGCTHITGLQECDIFLHSTAYMETLLVYRTCRFAEVP
jgi:hypothetical protein